MTIPITAWRRPRVTAPLALLVATLVVVAGCRPTSDGDAPRGVESTPQAPGAADARAGGGGDVDGATKQFIDDAAAGGKAEVELANLALDKGRSDAVKELARMIQQDHTQANAELLKLATTIGVTVDDTLKPEHQALAKRLAGLTDAQFDEAYAEAMVDEHRKDVQAFTDATRLDHGEIRAFAERTLPKLRSHLEHAQAVHDGRRSSDTATP